MNLFPKVNALRERAEYTASDVEARTRLKQMPVRERMAELEQKYTEKVKPGAGRAAAGSES